VTVIDRAALIVPGARVGKYEIVHRIAFGGMAEIYLARVSGIHGFEKHVVLKRILPQYAANDEFVRLFLREARLAATLDQANIAQVHDIGEIDGSYFFTMEYLHGEDLRVIMRETIRRGEKLPLEHALAITLGAAAGLHFAHEKKGSDGQSLGIVHQDVSPSNLVVTYDGGVKVVDFGIAKVSADPELSRGGAPKGKLAYMSPEHLHNQPVDRRSDVYSLGVVLFEITTHTRLFSSKSEVDMMRQVMDAIIPPPSSRSPGYPPDLEEIVMRALEKNPGRRYPSARDLRIDLEAFARRHDVHVSSVALADWMERTFGPKRELWRSVPVPAPPPPPPPAVPPPAAAAPEREAAEPIDSMAVTRVVTHFEIAAAPRAAQDSVDLGGAGVPTSPAPAQPRGWRRPFGLALGVAVLLVVAAGALVQGRRSAATAATAEARPSAASPVVLLVAEQGSVALDGAPAQARTAAGASPDAPRAERQAAIDPAAPAQAVAAPAGPLSTPGAPSPRLRTRTPERRPRNGADSFSASLASREGEIKRCLGQHPEQVAGSREISLRFRIQPDGHVTSVSLLPAPLEVTPLGACLVKVAARTVFARQAEPVTFRIPLTLQVQAEEKPRR
jgi:serine/threonine protein kinase